MKVLTLNTHSWLENQPLEKLQQLADQIIKEDYALIALQEVNQRIDSLPAITTHNFHPTEDQLPIHEDNFAYLLVQLLKEQGYNYHWSWAYNHIGYSIYHEGVALLSKQPIQPQAVVVSAEKDPRDYRRRVLLIGQTKLGDHCITALSCHYSWWSETGGFSYEWQQTEIALQEHISPLLMMGDFNNPASAKTGHALVLDSPLQLQDSFLIACEKIGEHTVEKAIDGWGENQEKLRIDYIFTSKKISVSSYQIVFDGKSTPVISDHFGVSAIIQ
ncbi:maltose 6'-phosphate phosphatase [Enterococcus sp. DIV0840]|uniref:endonuclease/exonuclease/phosphatase family protein n=1 Tax=Enterococcus TaxID=1350 RepID=UPI001A8D7C1D|nr:MULTISPECIES: endonuclease/exonuclease/phosphatase family protein [Enterococcus]MBO0434839.1 endonuclease/exonuclease/phosphatase family protein [Enterococcus sp. DIV0849a]MBO0475262.1 endonuclease/exonuclease/phosphatase family protein [Enterococcus ureasiticus]